jgi:hypothetical protein
MLLIVMGAVSVILMQLVGWVNLSVFVRTSSISVISFPFYSTAH